MTDSFLSGSLDNGVRLWSVLENSVSYSKNLGDEVLITALEFSPDGLHCFVGGFNGSLFILETKGLFEVFRVEIKERSIVHPFVNKMVIKLLGSKFSITIYIRAQVYRVNWTSGLFWSQQTIPRSES